MLTAGDTSGGKYLCDVWLPSLRSKGEYSGDVLIFNYDLDKTHEESLRNDERVFVEKVEKTEGVFFCRHRDAYHLLQKKYFDYDVVLCSDGKDIVFQAPLEPLFLEAEKIVCCVVEPVLHKQWWNTINSPEGEKIQSVLADLPIINLGIYVGPLSQIVDVEKFILENYSFCADDQTWFNVMVYFHGFSVKLLDKTWNWGTKLGFKILNGVYFGLDDKKIAIFHKH